MFEEPGNHVTNVILPTDEHRYDTDCFTRLVDVEPVDRTSNGEMPQAGQDIVVAFAPMERGQDALLGCTNLANPCFRVIERTLHALAEVEVAAQEVIEYQTEVAFGLGRELNTEGHARGA